MLDLDPLRLGEGGTQPHAHIAGDVIPPHGQYGREHETAPLEHGYIRGTSTYVYHGHTQLHLVRHEDGPSCGEGQQDYVLYLKPGLVHAPEEVLNRSDGAGDYVRLYLQPHAEHSHGVLNSVVSIDYELPRQHVDDLPVRGEVDHPGGINGPLNVFGTDLLILSAHRHHATTVGEGYVAPADTNPDRFHPEACHTTGLLGGLGDCLDGSIYVNYYTLSQSPGGGRTHPYYVNLIMRVNFSYQGSDLGGPYVESHDVIVSGQYSYPPRGSLPFKFNMP